MWRAAAASITNRPRSTHRRWVSSALNEGVGYFKTGDAGHPPLVMGCVCYDPAVEDIWAGIRTYLRDQRGVHFDYVLFTNYEAQVRSLLNGHIDLAWNGPIAHVMTEELAHRTPGTTVVSLGMRDVDRDVQSTIIVKRSAKIRTLEELQHRHILTGASDSPQAHLVPLYHLRTSSITLGQITAFDLDLGKHGDTAVGEIKAMEALSTTEQGDAAIVSTLMWERAVQGRIPTLDPVRLQDACEELVEARRLPTFDHCQFDAILTVDKEPKLREFSEALLSMDWNIPEQRRLMTLEGIRKKWEGPRQTGYDLVRSAMGLRLDQHRPATNLQKRCMSSARRQERPPTRVAVVGAGVAGLQAIRALKSRGFDVTAFEGASTVGGLWKANYANFGVQVPKQLYEFQDFPMADVAWGEYASGPQVQAYIERYADAFGLRDVVKFNTRVAGVQQRVDGTWKVEMQSKEGTTTEDFEYLVMATGIYSVVNKVLLPGKPGQENFSGTVVHSSDFRDATAAKGKRVVVVGGGKSAIDCALEASRAGASSVTLLQRTSHWPTPRKIAGIIPFQYIFLSRLGTALVSAHRGTFPGGSGKAVNAFRNSILGPALVKPVFRMVEELFAFQFALRGDLRPKADVVSSFYDVAYVLNSDLPDMRRGEKVKMQMGEIDKYEGDSTLRLKDKSTLEADLIVSATGFAQDYSIFSDPTTREDLDLQTDGMYLYRYMLPLKVKNLAFIGHMAAISNISTYGLQAEWLARNLTGSLVSGGTNETTAHLKDEIEMPIAVCLCSCIKHIIMINSLGTWA
jgi:dimethylaniline monooxygenase (N-oxide forming)